MFFESIRSQYRNRQTEDSDDESKRNDWRKNNICWTILFGLGKDADAKNKGAWFRPC
jgi:hypothetical protein